MIKKLVAEAVVVKPDEVERTIARGIVIPDHVKKGLPMPKRGEVIHSTVKEIKKGDFVRFKPYSHVELQKGKNKLFIVEKDNIIAIERE